MQAVEIVVGLLILLALLVVVADKLALPYPVILVLSGLSLSFIPGLPTVRLNPEVVFLFFLPPLLYPAALFTSWRDFRQNVQSILWLAIGLVLATMLTVAWVAHAFIPGLPWAAAFALGAIVSPPDAIAATVVIRRLAVPRRIEAVLEGESLVNDATALVALQFAVAAMVTGKFSLGGASLRFIYVAAGGALLGLLVGYIMKWVQRQLDNPSVQTTLSLFTPFAAYLAAEHLHVSGVLAVVAAGIYLGWHSPLTLSARTRLQALAFWEMIAFLLNGFIFIVMGLQLPGILQVVNKGSLLPLIGEGLLISGVVVGARILWVFPASYLPRLFSRKFCAEHPKPSFGETAVVAWSGMRGVISLAAAFALPLALNNGQPFPGRSYILFLTFCVILTTLVFQGLTLPGLIRRFGVVDDGLTDEEERRARLEANRAAIDFIEERATVDSLPREIVDRLRAEYADRIEQL
jgi:CPA1 family monovalent cation:H+ antiporter